MLKGSADALWELARNPTLQLFATDWAAPPPSHATQAQENAAVLALHGLREPAGQLAWFARERISSTRLPRRGFGGGGSPLEERPSRVSAKKE